MITGPGMWGGNYGRFLGEIMEDLAGWSCQTENDDEEKHKHKPNVSRIRKFLVKHFLAFRLSEAIIELKKEELKAKEERIWLGEMRRRTR